MAASTGSSRTSTCWRRCDERGRGRPYRRARQTTWFLLPDGGCLRRRRWVLHVRSPRRVAKGQPRGGLARTVRHPRGSHGDRRPHRDAGVGVCRLGPPRDVRRHDTGVSRLWGEPPGRPSRRGQHRHRGGGVAPAGRDSHEHRRARHRVSDLWCGTGRRAGRGVQPHVRDEHRAGNGLAGLPATGDRTGYLRGFPTALTVRPQPAPVRCRSDRAGLPQRNKSTERARAGPGVLTGGARAVFRPRDRRTAAHTGGRCLPPAVLGHTAGGRRRWSPGTHRRGGCRPGCHRE